MTIPANPMRKSVHRDNLVAWYGCGWAYVMPNFDQPNYYLIEWLSTTAPVEPSNRVPENSTENANERADTRRQQPA